MDGLFESERTAQDVLLGRLPLRLAGQTFVLPVLTTGQNVDWQASLDATLVPLLPDDANPADLLSAMGQVDLLGFVYSYDLFGQLPPRQTIERDIYPHELIRAVQEVRLATNPTVAYAIALTMDEAREAMTRHLAAPPPNRAQRRSARTSSRRRPTAGPTEPSVTS